MKRNKWSKKINEMWKVWTKIKRDWKVQWVWNGSKQFGKGSKWVQRGAKWFKRGVKGCKMFEMFEKCENAYRKGNEYHRGDA
jgi:hypothetical protein